MERSIEVFVYTIVEIVNLQVAEMISLVNCLKQRATELALSEPGPVGIEDHQ